MKIDITNEIFFKTARSSGSGGQNVNKVETMVEGRWIIAQSNLITSEQKKIIAKKLYHKITADGVLLVKSQTSRTQLGNKEIVIKKMNSLANVALIPKKIRIASTVTKAAKEKRLAQKKRNAEQKQSRKSLKPGDY